MRLRKNILSKSILSLLLLIFILESSWAQVLEIKNVKVSDGDILIDYDLLDENRDHKYVIELYSSADEYIQPLKETEGDIGIDLAVGGNKQVIWHASKELGNDFNGKLAFELKGRLYIPFVQLNDFDKINKIKKDKPLTVTWAAGRGSDVLTWDLFNEKEELVHTFTNIANVGEYEVVIPKDVSSGKGYYFRITDKDNKDDIVNTPRFQVVRKVPMIVNIAIGAAALVVGYIIYDNVSAGGSESPEEQVIPDPNLGPAN